MSNIEQNKEEVHLRLSVTSSSKASLPVEKVRSAGEKILKEKPSDAERRDKKMSVDSSKEHIARLQQAILDNGMEQTKFTTTGTPELKQQIEQDGIQEIFKRGNTHDEDKIIPQERTRRKGVCFGIAEDSGGICRKGVCQPSEELREKKSETGRDYKVAKKICRRENFGILSCLNRPTAKDKIIPIEQMDKSSCVTLTETTVYKTSATDVTKESKLSEGTSKHFERSDKNRGAHWNEKDMIVDDEDISKTTAMSKTVEHEEDGIGEVAEVCECCNCAICRCKPKYVKRVYTESDINMRRMKGLHQARAGDRVRMTYSFDTLFVPSDWDFQRDQEAIRKAEMDQLISEAEESEEYRLRYMESQEEGETEEGEEDKDIASKAARNKKKITELDWEAYRAVEWAGLRHQYTAEAEPIDLEASEKFSNISWTSQPPPRFVLGTVRTRSAPKPTGSTQMQPIGERKSSFVKMGSKKLQVRVVKTKEEIDEAYAENKMGKRMKKSDKKDVLTDSSIPQDTSSEDIEHRAEFYESHLPHTEKKKKLRVHAREIDENRLPMGLKREAQKMKKAELSQTELKKAKRVKKSVPYKTLPTQAAARLAKLQSLDATETQSCPCLPGYCTCEGRAHWTVLESKVHQDLIGTKSEGKIEGDKMKRTDSELEAAGVYVWKGFECPCLHVYDDEDIQVLPEGSEDFIGDETKKSKKKIEDDYICSCEKRYEHTVLLIKPDAMIFQDVIKRALVYYGGLQIINERKIRLSPEQVSEIYSDKYYGTQSYPLFVLKMSRNPILALCVAGIRAMDVVKSMIGPDKYIPESWFFPESIKRRFVPSEDLEDALHIAEDAEESAIESRYFFPNRIVEPIPTIPSRIKDFCNKYLDPTLTKGLAAAAKVRPEDPIIFLAEFLLTHNPFQPLYKPHDLNMA